MESFVLQPHRKPIHNSITFQYYTVYYPYQELILLLLSYLGFMNSRWTAALFSRSQLVIRMGQTIWPKLSRISASKLE